MTRIKFTLSIFALTTFGTVSAQLDSTTLFQVEKGIELENIAVRSNGEILACGVGRPALYQFNPETSAGLSDSITIPGATSLFGIAETSHDVFAVAAGNWTRGKILTPGTFSTWIVNFKSPEPIISKIVDFPQAAFLNGMTAIPPQSPNENSTFLVSDTATGRIYHVHPTTSMIETVLAIDVTTNTTTTPCAPQAGVNGIRYNRFDQTLYYTNTIKGVFCKVKLAISYPEVGGLSSLSINGPYTVIASRIPGDDFAVTPDGTAYIGANPVNTVFKVTPTGNMTIFAGGMNETVVAGATSAAFGRTLGLGSVLYVSTNGIPPLETNATSEGGKVVALSLTDEFPGSCEQ